eukprot:8824648-Pyramimonas_sp.AAC.1
MTFRSSARIASPTPPCAADGLPPRPEQQGGPEALAWIILGPGSVYTGLRRCCQRPPRWGRSRWGRGIAPHHQ